MREKDQQRSTHLISAERAKKKKKSAPNYNISTGYFESCAYRTDSTQQHYSLVVSIVAYAEHEYYTRTSTKINVSRDYI